jgi:acyl-homoserine-lactone acylase
MAEIVWDRFEVPHIFARDAPDLFCAFGHAQMRNHANLILRLIGQARGRAAEYWGAGYLHTDRWVHMMGIPERARQWQASQSPEFGQWLAAFVSGINSYGQGHLDEIDDAVRVVLPITVEDVLAHAQRVVNFAFVVNLATLSSLVEGQPNPTTTIQAPAPGAGETLGIDGRSFGANPSNVPGSNAWAIGPRMSAGGSAMLLTNPHLPWSDMFRLFEADLHAPAIDAYGITLVGLPVLTMAFNNSLGWSHTVNTYRGWTLYDLQIVAGGYMLDGDVKPFEVSRKTLLVRQPDGTCREEPLILRQSLHGPVIATRNGRAFALRVAGLDRSRGLEQWWKMTAAGTLDEFEAALADMQIPMFTVIYADRKGNILHFYNGQIPVRPFNPPRDWDNIVPGDRSGTLWRKTHEYKELPRVVNPLSGWLQNSNDPPWTTTLPPALDPDDYPVYVAPRGPMNMRARRAIRLLTTRQTLSLEEMIHDKYAADVELAEHVLDDLVAAALADTRATVRRAGAVLAAWDRRADIESRGAVLFAYWAEAMDYSQSRGTPPEALWKTAWTQAEPSTTPRGLANPAGAATVLATIAAKVEAVYGALDVSWGKVFQHPRTGIVSSRAAGTAIRQPLNFRIPCGRSFC